MGLNNVNVGRIGGKNTITIDSAVKNEGAKELKRDIKVDLKV